MNIRKYQQGDIFKVIQTNNEQYMMRYANEDYMLKGISFTGTDGDKIIGCAGLYPLWEGVLEAWIALDEESKKDRASIIHILRTLKDCLANLPKDIVRVHALVNEHLEGHERFMMFLEFQPEAILKDYFPNHGNCIVYRRV